MYRNAQEYIEAYERGEVKDLEDFPKYIENFIYKRCLDFTNIAPLEELYQVAWVAIMENIHNYDSTKGSGILSYLNDSIEKRFLRLIRDSNTLKRRINKETSSLDKQLTIEGNNFNLLTLIYYDKDSAEDKAICSIYKDIYFEYSSKQSSKVELILNLTFYGFTQVEISKIIKTTRSYVQRVLRIHRERLKKVMFDNETLKSKVF